MSYTLRKELEAAVIDCWQDRSKIIWENAKSHDATLLANGYLKFAVSFTRTSDAFVSSNMLAEGTVYLTLAVPLGKGMTKADSGVARLDRHLSNKQFAAIRTANMHTAPAFASAGFWLTEIELDFLVWKGTQ